MKSRVEYMCVGGYTTISLVFCVTFSQNLEYVADSLAAKNEKYEKILEITYVDLLYRSNWQFSTFTHE